MNLTNKQNYFLLICVTLACLNFEINPLFFGDAGHCYEQLKEPMLIAKYDNTILNIQPVPPPAIPCSTAGIAPIDFSLSLRLGLMSPAIILFIILIF